MRQITKIVYGVFAVTLLVSNLPITKTADASLRSTIESTVESAVDSVSETAQSIAETITQPESAAAAQAAPSRMQVAVRDNGCSDQERDYGYADYIPAQGANSYDEGYVTDQNGKDPECARINLWAGDTATGSGGLIYSLDFRIGVSVAESDGGCTDRRGTTRWTPWASEGGGESSIATPSSGSVEDADCIWITYATRSMPAGVVLKNARVGISTHYSGMQYTPWATSGGGWSGWTSAHDFTTARVGLGVELNRKYNADYVSSSIPQSPTSIAINTPVSGNIVMKNIPYPGAATALPWLTDSEISSTTNKGLTAHCYDWTPSSSSDTCTQTTVYESTKFKLKRIDSNTAAVETPAGDLKYKRTVISQWGATPEYGDDICTYPTGGNGPTGDGPILPEPPISFNNILNKFGLVKTAQAAPVDPGDVPDCTPGPPTGNYLPAYQSQNQSQNIETNQNATFDGLTITGRANGTFTLEFQMVNLEPNPVEMFGDYPADPLISANTVARITVRIGTPAAWTLNCAPPTQSVSQLNQSVATYTLSATVPSGYTSPINVTMTSVNVNDAADTNLPVMETSPTVLQYTAFPLTRYYSGVNIPIDTLTQNTTYRLTFTGTDGSSTQSCQVILILEPIVVNVNLQFNNGLGSYEGPTHPVPTNGSTGTLIWVTENAASCTGTMDQGADTSAGTSPDGPWIAPRNVAEGTNEDFDVKGMQVGQTYIFRITCLGTYGGEDFDVVEVRVALVDEPPVPDLKCRGYNNPAYTDGLPSDPCVVVENITDGSAITSLRWTSQFAVACSITTLGFVAPPTFNETTGVNSGNLTTLAGVPAPYTVTLTMSCEGFSSQIRTDTVTVQVLQVPQPPNDPDVSFDFSVCGKVRIIISPSVIPPPVTGYIIGWGTAEENITHIIQREGNLTGVTEATEWVVDHDENTVDLETGQPIPPMAAGNYYKVGLFNGTGLPPGLPPSGDAGTVVIPDVGMNPCNLSMDLSDKDIISVGTETDPDLYYTNNNPHLASCTGDTNTTFPDGSATTDGHEIITDDKIFEVGQIVTYRITACNDGDVPLTNVEVEDTLENLTVLNKGIQYSTINGVTCKKSAEQFNVGGNPSRFIVSFKDLPVSVDGAGVPDGGVTACSVTFKARITAPSVTTSALYSFRNTAVARAAGASEDLLGPYYKFSLGSNIPIRNEKPPQ